MSTAANRGKAQVVPLAGGIIRLQPLEKVAVGRWCRAPSFGIHSYLVRDINAIFLACRGQGHHLVSRRPGSLLLVWQLPTISFENIHTYIDRYICIERE